MNTIKIGSNNNQDYLDLEKRLTEFLRTAGFDHPGLEFAVRNVFNNIGNVGRYPITVSISDDLKEAEIYREPVKLDGKQIYSYVQKTIQIDDNDDLVLFSSSGSCVGKQDYIDNLSSQQKESGLDKYVNQSYSIKGVTICDWNYEKYDRDCGALMVRNSIHGDLPVTVEPEKGCYACTGVGIMPKEYEMEWNINTNANYVSNFLNYADHSCTRTREYLGVADSVTRIHNFGEQGLTSSREQYYVHSEHPEVFRVDVDACVCKDGKYKEDYKYIEKSNNPYVGIEKIAEMDNLEAYQELYSKMDVSRNQTR